MEAHRKGDATEAAVLSELKQRNIPVGVPFGDNEPYDLLAETPQGRVLRLQVKTAEYNEKYIEFRGIRQHTNSRGNVRKRYVGDIDYFLVYSPELHEMYLVEEDIVGTRMRLRLKGAKQDHSTINWADEYEFDTRWPPTAHSATEGFEDDITEIAVESLRNLGATVLQEWGAENPRKLVTIHEDIPIHLHLEAGQVTNGRIRFPANGDEHTDCYLVYVNELDQLYVIDAREFDESISLRVIEPEQADSSINWAKDYEFEQNWPPWRGDNPRRAMDPGVRRTVKELEKRGHDVQYPDEKASQTLVVDPSSDPIYLRVACAWNEQGRLHFDPGERNVDYHVVYYRESDELYLVSDDEFKQTITLRVDPPEKDDASINWAEDYAFDDVWPPEEERA